MEIKSKTFRFQEEQHFDGTVRTKTAIPYHAAYISIPFKGMGWLRDSINWYSFAKWFIWFLITVFLLILLYRKSTP